MNNINSNKTKIYYAIIEKLDPIPYINFKYDFKMSTKNRKRLNNESIEIVKNFYMSFDSDYNEIISKPLSDIGDINEEIKESLENLKEMDFQRLHGRLNIRSLQEWEIARRKIVKDINFLQSAKIMNYSLILIIVKVEEINMEVFKQKGNYLLSPSGKFAYIFGIEDFLHEYNFEKEDGNVFQASKVYANRFLEGLNKIFIHSN